jgi:hypothetical protein
VGYELHERWSGDPPPVTLDHAVEYTCERAIAFVHVGYVSGQCDERACVILELGIRFNLGCLDRCN